MPLPAIGVAFWIGVQAFIFSTLVPLVVHLLTAFGVGVVAYTGASIIITTAENYVFSSYDNLPIRVWQMLTLGGVDAGLKILFSAYAANIAIRGVSGAIKKFKFVA